MSKMKLNINSLKKDKCLLLLANKKFFELLKHSGITIDENGISTNAGTKDDSSIPYRDSLVIGSLIFNALILIIDKWDSFDKDCKEFIESNLEMLTNYMEEKWNTNTILSLK